MLGRSVAKAPIRQRFRAAAVRFNSPGWDGGWDRNDPKNPNRPHPFWKMVFPHFHKQDLDDDIMDQDRRPSQYYDFDAPRAHHRKGAKYKASKKHNWAEMYDWSSQEFKKMNTPNYLKLTDEQLKLGCIGYLSEEDDSDPTIHPEYHLPYKQASADYKREVLEDKCLGRPSYEWQIPFGFDELRGYKSLITAVDVMGNPQAIANTKMDFEKETEAQVTHNAIKLVNKRRGQTVFIVPQSSVPSAISHFKPDTTVFSYAADKNIDTVHKIWNSRSVDDRYVFMCTLAWGGLFYMGPFFPTDPVTASVVLAGQAALHTAHAIWVYAMPETLQLKRALAACRSQKQKVVFADWLEEDYDERYFRSQGHDEAARLSGRGNSGFYPWKSQLSRAMGFLRDCVEESPLNPARKTKNVNHVHSDSFPETYRDVINLKRVDILANVVNNVEFAWLNPDPDEQDPDEIPETVMVAVRELDDLPVESVQALLADRLTGKTECPNPFVFSEDFERCSIEFDYPEASETAPHQDTKGFIPATVFANH